MGQLPVWNEGMTQNLAWPMTMVSSLIDSEIKIQYSDRTSLSDQGPQDLIDQNGLFPMDKVATARDQAEMGPGNAARASPGDLLEGQ